MTCTRQPGRPVNSPVEVVLVDDAADVRAMVDVCLRSRGLRVLEEGDSARQAVVLAVAHRPDVMILDHSMPGGGGIDAVPLVKRASPTTRVVIYSGDSSPALEEAALAAGADAFVRKGGRLDELVDVVIDLTAVD